MGLLDSMVTGSRRNDPREIAKKWATVRGLLDGPQQPQEQPQEQPLGQPPAGTGQMPPAADLGASPQGQPQQPQGQDPLAEWKETIDKMMLSGNRTLQKEAMSMISQYHQKATTQTTADKPATSIQEYEYAVKNGYKGSYTDWEQFSSPSTTINMNQGEKYLTHAQVKNMVDAEGEPITEAPAGMTMADVVEKGWKWKPELATASEAKEIAGRAVSVDMVEDLIKIASSTNGELYGWKGKLNSFLSGSTAGAVAMNEIFKGLGVPVNPKTVEAMSITHSLGNTLIQAMRGAQVGDKEKADFIKQLPVPGQTKEHFISNALLTIKNLKRMGISIDEQRILTQVSNYNDDKPNSNFMPETTDMGATVGGTSSNSNIDYGDDD